MGIIGRAKTGYRDVTITFVAENQPIGGYKACVRRVEQMEAQYNLNNASVTDLTAEGILITGTLNDETYLYNLTLDISAGTYAFDFQSVRNPDGSVIS